MSLSEQFIQHYFDDKGGDDPVRREEVKLLCEKFALDEEGTNGYILTKQQFDDLSNCFSLYAQKSCGIWYLQFHPKSGHVLHYYPLDYVSFNVYPSRGMSENIAFFKWCFNVSVCKDWVEFNEEIKHTNCEYISIKYGKGFNEVFLCSYDPVEDQYYETSVHVGGGRPYHEPSAQPYYPTEVDAIIDDAKDPVYTKSARKH